MVKRKIENPNKGQAPKIQKVYTTRSMLCTICDQPVASDSSIRCFICSSSQHLKCACMTEAYHQNYIIKRQIPWKCLECTLLESNETSQKLEELSNSIAANSNSLGQQIGAVASSVEVQESRIVALERSSALQSSSHQSSLQQSTETALIRKSAIGFEAIKLASNLIISGIAVKPAEDLSNIVKAIALKLNIVLKKSTIKKAVQLTNPKKQNSSGLPPSILVAFSSSQVKEDLLDAYFKKVKSKQYLTTKEINIVPDTRIYFNRHIPRLLQDLHNRIVNLKKDKVIDSFVVKSDEIRIKYQGAWHSVTSHGELNNVLTISDVHDE